MPIKFFRRLLLERRASRTCVVEGPRPHSFEGIWMYGGGTVRFGRNVVLDTSRGPIELHVEHGAVLELGDDVRIHGGASIEALESVVIGAGATLGAWTKVMDNHFHPLEGDRDGRPASQPVEVGAGGQIGERCVLLAGAHIGAGARLAPGVVMGRRVPDGAWIEGSPPRRVPSRGNA